MRLTGKELNILGAGGHARTMIDLPLTVGARPIRLIDRDRLARIVNGVADIGGDDVLLPSLLAGAVGGGPRTRAGFGNAVRPEVPFGHHVIILEVCAVVCDTPSGARGAPARPSRRH